MTIDAARCNSFCWYFCLVAIASIALLAANTDTQAGRQTMRKDHYGPEVHGLQARVTLSQHGYRIGVPIVALCEVKNISSTEQILWHSGFWPNHLLLVKDVKGDELPLTPQGNLTRNDFNPGGERVKNYPERVAPGKKSTEEGGFDLTKLYQLRRPGLYSVQMIYEEHQRGWNGRVTSNLAWFRLTN